MVSRETKLSGESGIKVFFSSAEVIWIYPSCHALGQGLHSTDPLLTQNRPHLKQTVPQTAWEKALTYILGNTDAIYFRS